MSRMISSIPVAVKSSKRVAKWFTVNLDDATPPQTYVKLQHRSKHNRFYVFERILTGSRCWVFLVLTAVYVAWIVNSYTYLVAAESPAFYIGLLADLIFAVDTGLTAVKALITRNRGVKNALGIIVDILLVLPFWYGYLCFVGIDWIFIALRFVCFLRFYKIVGFVSGERLGRNGDPVVLTSVEVCAYGFVVLHGAACAWCYAACPGAVSSCNGWPAVLVVADLKLQRRIEWYFLALYYSCMVNFNYGYLLSNDYLDKLGIAIGLITTLLLSIYFISNAFFAFLLSNKRKMHRYLELEHAKARCERINHHSTNLTKTYQLEWINKRGVSAARLSHLLPPSILADALFDINLPALKNTLVFRNGADSYLRHLSSAMRHEFLNDGDFVYRQGDEKNKMVVVIAGSVDVMSEEDDSSPIITFGPGTCLGESSMVYTLKSRSSVRAAKFVEIQSLHREDFYTTILHYPKQYTKIHRTIKSRTQEAIIKRMNAFTVFNRAASIKKIKNTPSPEKGSLFSLYRTHHPAKIPNFIIADSPMFLTWEILIVVNALVVAIAYPYHVGFLRKFPPWFVLPSILIEITFAADVILKLVTLGVAKGQKKRVKDVVLDNFNSLTFYLDVFSALYFEFFCYLLKDPDRYYYILKLNRLVKFYKFPPLLRKFEGRFACGIIVIRCVNSSVLFLVFSYWAGVAGYIFACFEEVCCPNGWFRLKIAEEKTGATEVPMFRDRLALSFYFVLSHVNTFELHEMHLRALKDMVFVAFVVIAGLIFISLTIADLSSLTLLRNKYRFGFLKDLQSLREFCDGCSVPARLKTRLFNYYRLQWDYDECCGLNAPRHSSHRDEELLVTEVLDCLRTVSLFADMDESFVRAVAARSKVYVLPPMDIVTYYGSMNKEMFVIKRGFCVYKTSGGVYRRIGPNSAFGTCSLFFNLSETVLVRTLSHCELVSVDGSALQEALNLHPEVNRFMKDVHKEIVYGAYVAESISMPEFGSDPRSKTASSFDWRKRFSGRGFVNVMSFCKKHKEPYAEPFTGPNAFFFLKFILIPTTILPGGAFITFWLTVRLTMSLLYGILIPVQQIACSYHQPLHRLLTFLDVISFADLYVMLHVCYYEERGGVLVVHPLMTARNYTKRSFFVDFFLSFPYEFLLKFKRAGYHEGDAARMHLLICSLRLIKVLHVYKVFAVFAHWKVYLEGKQLLLRFCEHVITSILFLNACACLLIFATCRYLNARDYEELKSAQFNFYKSNSSGIYCRAQSWLDRSRYADFTGFRDVYSTAFYWTANIMSGLSFGDLQVEGGVEMFLAIFVQLFGLFYACYLVATLVPHCVSGDAEVVDYKRNLRELQGVMEREGVVRELRVKVERNAVYTWRRTHDINTTKLFSCLHTTLLQDVLSFLYEETLRLVPLFGGMDRSFLRILAMVVRPQYFLEGQVVVERDDIIDELYIVHRGTVCVELARSTVKHDLIRGSVFGYYYNESVPNMTITATAISNVDVLCIRTVDYYNILKNYSKFHGKIKDVVSEYKDFMPSKAQDRNTMSIIICEKQKTQGKLRRKCGVDHTVPILQCFDIIVLTAAYINCIIRVSAFVFQTNCFLYWNAALEVIFAVRLVLNFFRPYHDEYGELVTNRGMLRNNYLKNTKTVLLDFTLSLLACGSFSLFHPQLQFPDWFYYHTIINLFTAARIFYLLGYCRRRRKELDANQIVLNLFSLCVWTSLSLHLLTSAWILVERFEKKRTGEDHLVEFIDAMYFVVNVLTRTGLSEVELRSMSEKVFVVSVLILQKFLFALLLGSMINTLWIPLKFPFAFRYRLKELQDYFTCANVDKYQIKTMLKYLKKFWRYERARKLPELLSKLPIPVANEVKIAVYKPLLSRSYLFAKTEDHFLDNIALLVEHTVYYGNDFIVHDGQIDERMYFIKTGEVEILSMNANHTENVHDVLHEGEMFGLAQGLFSSTPHQYSFRARNRCEILALQLEKWDHLLGFYEDSKEIIYKRIRNLHMQLNK